MAKVIGLGGIFFKSRDPKALGAWYRTWLDLPVGPYGATLLPEAMPPGGWQVWSAFPADTDYFAPSASPLMINLVVDDLDGCLERVAAGGATVLPGARRRGVRPLRLVPRSRRQQGRTVAAAGGAPGDAAGD